MSDHLFTRIKNAIQRQLGKSSANPDENPDEETAEQEMLGDGGEPDVSDSFARRFGTIVLLITFGLFGVWAAFAPLDSASIAPGTVTVKNYRRTVQHLEGGIVKQIFVRDGQHVEKGKQLLVLDTTELGSELEILRGQYFSLAAMEGRLVAERDGLPDLQFSPQLDSEQDQRAVEAKTNEITLFKARLLDRQGEVKVLEQQIKQLNSQIGGLGSLIKSKTELIESYVEEISDLEELLADGFVDKRRLTDVKRSMTRTEGEIVGHRASIEEAKLKIAEAKLQIVQKDMKFQTEVIDELGRVRATLFDVKEKRTISLDRVARSVIVAPVGGKILGLSMHTIGGVIKPGESLLDVVPDNEELVIEAKLIPVDIDRVSIGDKADIRFSAFKRATTPVIEGELVSISADSLVDEQTGTSYYLARVEITQKGRDALDNLVLVPGMPAEVVIKTGERTLLEYIIQPATNVFARSLTEE